MTMASVSRQTLADQVVDRVVEAIVTGELAPGSPISENEIALRVGVSRGPAREAIFRLEAKGLVSRAAHLGARVVDLDIDDLRNLFEVREVLEGLACRLAATRASDAEIAALEESLAGHAMRPEIVAGQSYYQPGGDQDFHVGIVTASRNARLARVLTGDLYEVMRLYRFRSSLRPGRALDALSEHRAIVTALKSRDPDAAENAMRAHIRASWDNTRATFRSAV